MNHLEKAAAALALCEETGLTKEAWDRDAWYSYIPVVGDLGNAVSNASDGNYWSALGNVGMAALNFIPGAGLAAQGLKLGAKGLGGLAAKGIAKGFTGAASTGLRTAGKALGRTLPSKMMRSGLARATTRAPGAAAAGKLSGRVGWGSRGVMKYMARKPKSALLWTSALKFGNPAQQQQPQQQQSGLGFGWGNPSQNYNSSLLGAGGQNTGHENRFI